MPQFKPLPPLSDLQEILSYEPDTGLFRWRKRVAYRVRVGDVAGHITKETGYVTIGHTVGGKLRHLKAGRLAWLFFYGEDPLQFQIDHINGDKGDNRIENLRLATHNQNQYNRTKYANNTSGYKGVSWHTTSDAWMAHVQFRGVSHRRYCFPTPEAAYEWACAKREELHASYVRQA